MAFKIGNIVMRLISTMLTFGLSKHMGNYKVSDGVTLVDNDVLKNKKVTYTKLK